MGTPSSSNHALRIGKVSAVPRHLDALDARAPELRPYGTSHAVNPSIKIDLKSPPFEPGTYPHHKGHFQSSHERYDLAPLDTSDPEAQGWRAKARRAQ
jgi:hypothetical protein